MCVASSLVNDFVYPYEIENVFCFFYYETYLSIKYILAVEKKKQL